MQNKLLYFLLLLSTTIWAQNQPVAIGNWRIHLNYQNVKQLAEVKNKIYCASTNGLYYYDKENRVTERLSPINGFSGYNVDAIHTVEDKDLLIIAYTGGDIEFVKNNTVTLNEDIKRKIIIGDKKINHINSVGDFAYFSTSFGLLEYNLVKNEFRNSYLNIGPNGTQVEILSSAVLNDSIFVTTKIGILKGSLNPSINLSDYNNWFVSKTASIRSTYIASFNNNLYSEIDSSLYIYKQGQWSLYETGNNLIVTNINVFHNKLLIGVFGKHIITEDNQSIKTYNTVNVLNYCILDKDNDYWHASPQYGLVSMGSAGSYSFYPNGPRSKDNFNFINADGKLYCSAGAFSSTTYAPEFNSNRFYTFDNFNWQNSESSPLTDNMFDFTYMATNKANGNLFIGTHGKGLIQLQNGTPIKVYDETNSPMQKRGGAFCIVSGLAIDKGNNLWVSNFDIDSALLQLSNKGAWTRYKLPLKQLGPMTIDSRNNKWIITPRSAPSNGILFFSDKGTITQNDDISILLNANKGSGSLPSNSITALAFTKDGELLVGTDQGYGRIRSPNNILNGGNFDFERIIVSVEVGTNLGGYLLGSEYINCITLDGADRRWIGTNNGAWLLAEDGETILQHFTIDNSPLLSNNVISIGILESTGEVFFGTDKGIISYKSNALNESKDLSKIVIYPNPVKPDFDGEIAITGLASNTLVKITDINGQLVYQTTSNGGMATWNCRTFDGTRPATGVYLAFCINSDGTQTGMGKILFIK
ncbi:MAG: two-component regulator propeller domain-containing protein [bacterium]|nr:two-component regulator propeller domain-containing protein [bacterium]